VLDSCIENKFVLKAITKGGSGKYQYDWGDGFQQSQYYTFSGNNSANIMLISSDLKSVDFGARDEIASIPDTAYANIVVNSPCSCNDNITSTSFDYKTTNHIVT